jgi:hypothetical protein
MAYEAMFATISPFLVIYDNTTKTSINFQILTELEPLTLAWQEEFRASAGSSLSPDRACVGRKSIQNATNLKLSDRQGSETKNFLEYVYDQRCLRIQSTRKSPI